MVSNYLHTQHEDLFAVNDLIFNTNISSEAELLIFIETFDRSCIYSLHSLNHISFLWEAILLCIRYFIHLIGSRVFSRNADMKLLLFIRLHIKNSNTQIVQSNTFHFLRYAKCVFTNIQKQLNTVKSILLFKKKKKKTLPANNSRTFRIHNAKFSGYSFIYEHKHIDRFSYLH